MSIRKTPDKWPGQARLPARLRVVHVSLVAPALLALLTFLSFLSFLPACRVAEPNPESPEQTKSKQAPPSVAPSPAPTDLSYYADPSKPETLAGAQPLPAPLPFIFSGRQLQLGSDAPDLKSLLALAHSGDRLLIPPGTWNGGLIDKTVALIGQGGVFDGHGQGHVLRIDAPGVLLQDLIIQGSGRNLRGPDSGVYLSPTATGTTLSGLQIRNCLFGIWVHETHFARLLHNRIHGDTTSHPSNRGNGIQLFNGSRLLVQGNHISGGRDGIYIAATEDSWIDSNLAQGVRYGIHYMFSHSNSVINNRCLDNHIGFALMQSRQLEVLDNFASGNKTHGLLFRDAQYCLITRNRLERNGEGLFFYSSNENTVLDNLISGNKVGAKIWAGCYRNHVSRNFFDGNEQQVFYVGTADLEWGLQHDGNQWSDYLGWDQNRDGIGDRPYRVNSFSSHLVYRYPASGLLLRSPALELLAHLERILPLFRQPTILDHAPLLGHHLPVPQPAPQSSQLTHLQRDESLTVPIHP